MLGTESNRSCSDRVDVWAVNVVSSGGRSAPNSTLDPPTSGRLPWLTGERWPLLPHFEPTASGPCTGDAGSVDCADPPPHPRSRQRAGREGRCRHGLTDDRRRERTLIVDLDRVARGTGHVGPVEHDGLA